MDDGTCTGIFFSFFAPPFSLAPENIS